MRSFGRNCPKFDSLTRSFFDLDPDLELETWESKCVEFPRIRRGSVALSERVFFSHLRTLADPEVVEIGGNIGRHTKLFLQENIQRLHTFEPNIELFHNFSDLVGREDFVFNPFGLSSSNGIKQFNIVTSVEGLPAGTTHGMGSFENVGPKYEDIYGETRTRIITVAHFRADTYLQEVNVPKSSPLVVWLDVEGHALEVLRGFGDQLGRVESVIVELETDTRYISEPNADAIIELCAQYELAPVWRDIQYYGRFNVLFARKPLDAIIGQSEFGEVERFIKNVQVFSQGQ